MLVGIHGISRSGKDETANILAAKYDFTKRNLANPIRQVLLGVFDSLPWTADIRATVELYGWDFAKEEHPWTVEAMIALGQGMRDIDEETWIRHALDGYGIDFVNLVLPDIRQPNEVEMILNNGGQMWLVEREGMTPRGMDNLLKDVPYEYIIENSGTLTDLMHSVDAIMDLEITKSLDWEVEHDR